MITDFIETLYKKDSKGKLRMLSIETSHGQLLRTSGLMDGEKVEHSKMCKPKNVGRANETTAQQQAVAEAKALIKKKLREGYFHTDTEAMQTEVLLPMLAKSFEKESHKVKYPCYVQPKLDGMRCLKIGQSMKSRKNVEIDTMGHIAIQPTGMGVLDGELYAHGLSFQENMRLIKKFRKESTTVKFHVYDFVSDLPFPQRLELLKDAVSKAVDCIELVPTYLISDEIQLKEYHQRFIGEGYEGTMVRWGEDGYKINGRSSNLLKYKDFIDITLPIKDVVPDDVNSEHGSFVFDWEGAKGHRLGDDILGCGMKFSHAERAEILIDKVKYRGRTAELRFFEYSDTGVPRFPVCHGIRLDK